jgi:hypothetical protein
MWRSCAPLETRVCRPLLPCHSNAGSHSDSRQLPWTWDVSLNFLAGKLGGRLIICRCDITFADQYIECRETGAHQSACNSSLPIGACRRQQAGHGRRYTSPKRPRAGQVALPECPIEQFCAPPICYDGELIGLQIVQLATAASRPQWRGSFRPKGNHRLRWQRHAHMAQPQSYPSYVGREGSSGRWGPSGKKGSTNLSGVTMDGHFHELHGERGGSAVASSAGATSHEERPTKHEPPSERNPINHQ